jgi:hypothetical protein
MMRGKFLRVLVPATSFVCVSGVVYADQRFDGVWTVDQVNGPGCTWTPPPYPIRITNGRVSVISGSGSVSPSGEIRWSVTNKEGNMGVHTGQLRGRSGSGNLVVVAKGSTCQGTFTMQRRR